MFDGWCKLQTSYLIDTGIYTCTPCDYAVNSGYNGDGANGCTSYVSCPGGVLLYPPPATVSITCEQEALCANGTYEQGLRTSTFPTICSCDASGCKLTATSPDITLDATLIENQQTLTGSLVFGNTNRTIWLQRQ